MRTHVVDMHPAERRGGYERFRYHCLDCPWTLMVVEDHTTTGTPPDAHQQAEAHRTVGGAG